MCLIVYLLYITFWNTMRPKSKFLAEGMKRSKSTTNAKVIFKEYHGNTTRIILLLIHQFCSAIHFPFSQFKIHKISQCGRFQLFLVIQFAHNCCTLQIHILNTEAGTKPCLCALWIFLVPRIPEVYLKIPTPWEVIPHTTESMGWKCMYKRKIND